MTFKTTTIMNEKYFEKDLTYRAKVRVKAGTDEIIVRPEAQGKPIKKDVVERGDSQMYTTTGKRNPKRVIQLMAPEKSGDLIGDMKKQFDAFIVEMGGTPSPDPIERPLKTNDPRLEVWISQERHELVVKKTVKLDVNTDYGTEISNLEGELRRCLLTNRTSLLSARSAR